MKNLRWANPEKKGVLYDQDNGVPMYLDGGPEFDRAVKMRPVEYAAPVVVQPDPEQIKAAERASMTAAQAAFRLAALRAGKLTAINKAVAVDAELSILWQFAARIDRVSRLGDALAAILSPAVLDDLFRAAETAA